MQPSGESIPGVQMTTISRGTVTGRTGGAGAADVEFLNREAGAFLDGVAVGGTKLSQSRRCHARRCSITSRH